MKSIKKIFAICGIVATFAIGSVAEAGMSGGVWTVQASPDGMREGAVLASAVRGIKAGVSGFPDEAREGSTPATPDKAQAGSRTPALNKTTATLIKGQTLQLKLSGTSAKVTWSSSNKAVASVSSKGKVTAKKKGTATITAKSGGKKYTCKVTVETPKLNKTSITITENKTYKLTLSGTGQTVTWSSSDRAIAKVGSTGRVRGVKAGECTVTAKIGKKKYSCHVEVTKAISTKTEEETLDTGAGKETGEQTGNVPETTPTPTPDPVTEQQVYDAILAMQPEYPEGMAWTNDNFYNWHGGIYSGGAGCAAFAFAMSDAAFGELPARKHTDYTKIRVGDILRVNNNTHSVIVLEVTNSEVVVAEGNYNDSIHWGRRLSRDELQGESNYILTRYPADAEY